MLVILGLAIVAVMSVVILVSPFAGLLLYLGWFFVRPQEFIIGLGGTFPLERILALAAMASMAVHFKMLRSRKFVSSPVSHALLAFLAVNYLSLASSIWMTNTLAVANELAKIVFLYYFVINLIDDYGRLRKVLWLYLLCVAWIAGSSIYNYYTDPYYAQGIQRATSLTLTYGDPNATAFNLTLALPFLFAFLAVNRRWWKRIILLSLLGLFLVSVALTGSRSGAILVVLALMLGALYSRRRWLLLPLGALVLLVSWIALPQEYQRRYESIFGFVDNLEMNKPVRNQSAYESAYGRIIGWEVSWKIFKDYPILGVGAGNFAAAFWGLDYSYKGRKGWSQPHNLPGQVISELGALGAITFLFFVFRILRSTRAVRRLVRTMRSPPSLSAALNRAVVMTIVLLFVAGFSGHNLYRYNWYLAAALAVVNLRLALRAKSEEQVSEAATEVRRAVSDSLEWSLYDAPVANRSYS